MSVLFCSLCPKIANYTADFKRSSNWTSHYSSITEPLLAAVKTATNFDVDQDDLDHFCDCLRTHYCHKLAWPQGMNNDLYNRLWAELTWQAYSQFKYPSIEENAQAGIGYLLRELWQVSSNYVANHVAMIVIYVSCIEHGCCSYSETNTEISALLWP